MLERKGGVGLVPTDPGLSNLTRPTRYESAFALSAIQHCKVTIGEGDIGLSARSTYFETTPLGTQDPSDGGQISLEHPITGLPEQGAVIVTGTAMQEIITYDGLDPETNAVLNIVRGQCGGVDNHPPLQNNNPLWVAKEDCILGRYNSATKALEICTLTGGEVTVLASTAVTLAAGATVWLWMEDLYDNVILKVSARAPRTPAMRCGPGTSAKAFVE